MMMVMVMVFVSPFQAVQEIFDHIESNPAMVSLVTTSMFCLYQEQVSRAPVYINTQVPISTFLLQVIDLLNPVEGQDHNLRDHRLFGTFVEGISELVVTDAKQWNTYLQQALKVRTALSRKWISKQ